MTGPEHYREAERLVARADDLLELAAQRHGEESAEAGFHMAMARAQVHATLALAAASATAGKMGYKAALAWENVAGADR